MAELQPSWDALVEAERSFARRSVANGTKAAFVSFLADDSILFRPRAVPGKKWMEENPAPASQLSWEPDFADISSGGDLGYTTGPWEVRRTPQDPPSAFGHYVTLWRKQANAEWKVELDNGIAHERVAKPTKVDAPQLGRELSTAASTAEADKARTAIRTADLRASASLQDYLAGDTRLLREGTLPAIGRPAAMTRLAGNPGSLTTSQIDLKLSGAADLAYSYGTAEFKPAGVSKQIEYANYLRIWKKQRDGSWQIVLDLLSPAPKP
jgi:ketosteroid isomerase-like protein